MNTWKVTIVFENKTIEVAIQAFSYSDAYIRVEQAYPGCRILAIKKQEVENKKRF